jgi:hypothetical protein
MKVKFSDVKLDIEKVRRIRSVKIQNYVESLKFHFPPGAIEVGAYYAAHRYFENLNEFATYVLALPYMNYDCYQLPSDNVSFELIALDKSATDTIIAGSFSSFLDFSRNAFLKLSIVAIDASPAFQLVIAGSGLTLFLETASDYVCFYEQPID